MPEIQITVKDKVAQTVGTPVIVCGNSDYTVTFTFDEEWDLYDAKTARFAFYQDGIFRYLDVLFDGDSVSVPVLRNTDEAAVGVYAGDIRTTTPARIPCMQCITDGAAAHNPPARDVYEQLLQYLEDLQNNGSCISELDFIGTDNSETGIAEEEE